jgi:hypothetical protein
MKRINKNKGEIFIGLCLGCIFGFGIGVILGGVIGIPILGIITGLGSGAICGSLIAMFV